MPASEVKFGAAATIVSGAHMFNARPAVDLSRLSDAERQVLRLLAEGHTAKSIANMISSTPTAVNERLREARRKTGIGSSRELARLLKSQENRHKQIGIGKASGLGSSVARSDADAWRPQTGVFAMIGLLTLTVAGAAAILTQAQAELGTTPQMLTDADLGTFAKEGPAWLYPVIRNEARDPNWAPVAERTLNDRYATAQFFGTKPQTLRVMCRTRTCEVAASIPTIEPGAAYGQSEAAIAEDLRTSGLIQTGAMVSGDSQSNRGVYLAYYLRAKR